MSACGDAQSWQCLQDGGEAPDFAEQIGCHEDFEALASQPLDASIPGARSVKTVIDRVDDNRLLFQNSTRYQTHWEFTSAHRSGDGLPIVPMLAQFSSTEYSSPSRRFVLGSLTHYEGPGVFVYEIAPYDTASAEMVADAYHRIADNLFAGDELYFHPTSTTIESIVADLPDSVKVISTEELFAGVDFQALNVAESYGQLRFITAAELDDSFLSFRDIAVLDTVPNDISVVMGIITSEFQTPLSHVNVLSQNRGTPNMALRDAYDNAELRALEGKWVHLVVTPFDYRLSEVDKSEADAWWDAHKPTAVQVPGLDLTATDLRDIEAVIDTDTEPLRQAIKTGTRAYGGKAAHYAALARIDEVPSPPAFAVPVYYYRQFMEQNGFDGQIAAMLEDEAFVNDPAERSAQLAALRTAMESAPVDADFEALLLAKLDQMPQVRMRFRSSTNAEDLDGFTGAGLYSSQSGDPADPARPVLDAVRHVWASTWNYRAFEERSYRSIDHMAVGMALLVHPAFPDEEANGVALTANPFDTSGLESAFYVNVQIGETSVVQPPAGITTDQLIYYFDRPNQPAVYISHSNLAGDGGVLTSAQLFELGSALAAIRSYFTGAYGQDGWWAMDVEFKFEAPPGQEPQLYIKQVRPFGGS